MWVDQPRNLNLKRFPFRVEIILDPFCPMNLNQTVIISQFQQFYVGITFIPKVKPRISIVQLLSFPSHLYKLYLSTKLPFD